MLDYAKLSCQNWVEKESIYHWKISQNDSSGHLPTPSYLPRIFSWVPPPLHDFEGYFGSSRISRILRILLNSVFMRIWDSFKIATIFWKFSFFLSLLFFGDCIDISWQGVSHLFDLSAHGMMLYNQNAHGILETNRLKFQHTFFYPYIRRGECCVPSSN